MGHKLGRLFFPVCLPACYDFNQHPEPILFSGHVSAGLCFPGLCLYSDRDYFFKIVFLGKKEAAAVGLGFIAWGIHKANYPFLQPVVWFAPWGYLLGALNEFTAALGLLLVNYHTRTTRNGGCPALCVPGPL